MVQTRSGGSLQGTPNGKAKARAGDSQSSRKRVSNGHVNDDGKRPQIANTTDRSRWRLLDESGRLTWHYLEDDKAAKEWPQSTADKWYLGFDTVRRLPILCTLSRDATGRTNVTCPP